MALYDEFGNPIEPSGPDDELRALHEALARRGMPEQVPQPMPQEYPEQYAVEDPYKQAADDWVTSSEQNLANDREQLELLAQQPQQQVPQPDIISGAGQLDPGPAQVDVPEGTPVPQAQPAQLPETQAANGQQVIDTARKIANERENNERAVEVATFSTVAAGDSLFGQAMGLIAKGYLGRIDDTNEKYAASYEQLAKGETTASELRAKGGDTLATAQLEESVASKQDADKAKVRLEREVKQGAEFMAKAKTEPNHARIFQGKGIAGAIGLALAAGLHGALAATQGRAGGPNPWIQQMNHMVEQDMALQQAEIQKNMKLADMSKEEQADLRREIDKNLTLSRALKFQAIATATKAEIDKIAAPQIIKAKLMERYAELQKRADDAFGQFVDVAGKAALASYQNREAQKMAMLKAKVKAAGRGGRGTTKDKEPPMAGGDPFGITPDFRKRMIEEEFQPAQLTSWATKAAASIRMADLISDYAAIAKRIMLPTANTRISDDDAAEIKRLKYTILRLGRDLSDAGKQFTESEIDMLDKSLGTVEQGKWKGPKNLDQAYFSRVVRDIAEDQKSRNIALGFRPDLLEEYQKATEAKVRYRPVSPPKEEEGATDVEVANNIDKAKTAMEKGNFEDARKTAINAAKAVKTELRNKKLPVELMAKRAAELDKIRNSLKEEGYQVDEFSKAQGNLAQALQKRGDALKKEYYRNQERLAEGIDHIGSREFTEKTERQKEIKKKLKILGISVRR